VGGQPEGGAAPDETGETGEKSTRERILDVALDLFTEKGFDKTSLREIAEQLGFSKAALYYHFSSKDDILMSLHMRLHELGKVAVGRLGSAPVGMDAWRVLLDEMVDDVLANRKIFVMHQRNQAAFENLHREHHEEAHEDLEELFRRALADPAVPVRDRVRLSCALGAVFTSLVLAGGMFDDVPSAELGGLLRGSIGDLLVPAVEESGHGGRRKAGNGEAPAAAPAD
jgi:AcrR family transcriptional regulator